MKLKFVGGKGQYVQGYPRRDIEVDSKAEAQRLIETGCYEAAEPEAIPAEPKEVSDE